MLLMKRKEIFTLALALCMGAGAFAESPLKGSQRTFSRPGVRYMQKVRPAEEGRTVLATDLPDGLVWNSKRRLVEGHINRPGEYSYNIIVGGADTVPVHLTVSDSLLLPTPMMGWLSWNVVQNRVSEDVMRETALAIRDKGLLDAGYKYIGIDDDWHCGAERPPSGYPAPDSIRFPNGMKPVGDFLHSLGLKFGIYSTAALHTCDVQFGSYGHEDVDARAYADWGVDFLKYDYCHVNSIGIGDYRERRVGKYVYKRMAEAIERCGRPIILYMCEWGTNSPWEWAHEVDSPVWRATHDHRDGWNGYPADNIANVRHTGIGVRQALYIMRDIWPYTGVNHFNDADMLCAGIHGRGDGSNALLDGVSFDGTNFVKDGKIYEGLNADEAATEFAMWCMWSSPLFLTFDIRNEIAPADMALLTNPEMIAINQDAMGQAAEFVSELDGVQLWVKDLENGDIAVAVVNMNDVPADYEFSAGLTDAIDSGIQYKVRNLIDRKDEAPFTCRMRLQIPPHGTRLLRFSK